MAETIISTVADVSEEVVQSLIGKFVHAPTNKHIVVDELEGEKEINAWFGGQVVGYEKSYMAYDYETKTFFDDPKVYFNLLLSDGMGYVLSQEELVLNEVTKEEFDEMVAAYIAQKMAEQQTIEAVEKPKLTIIETPKKIILPGEES